MQQEFLSLKRYVACGFDWGTFHVVKVSNVKLLRDMVSDPQTQWLVMVGRIEPAGVVIM